MTITAKKPSAAFTLVEVMIVVAIVGLLAVIAIPSYVKSRARSQATACINNLRQIESGAQQFAIEKGLHAGDVIVFPDDILPYVKLNSANAIPACPANGLYNLLNVGVTPQAVCSLGATVTPPHILE
jgi:type IV pilus assembly protein PilA